MEKNLKFYRKLPIPQEIKEQTVSTVGKVEGTGLDTAKTVLKQNPAIQQIVTQPSLQTETDLNKKTTEVLKSIQNLNLKNRSFLLPSLHSDRRNRSQDSHPAAAVRPSPP